MDGGGLINMSTGGMEMNPLVYNNGQMQGGQTSPGQGPGIGPGMSAGGMTSAAAAMGAGFNSMAAAGGSTAGMGFFPTTESMFSLWNLQAATSPAVAHALAATQQTQKRPRSEKKAIPDEAKDDKYFERRKRNNSAAKKSRDARKAREDEIAIRASFLEKENAILRAQVATLREEANSLRQLLLQKRSRP